MLMTVLSTRHAITTMEAIHVNVTLVSSQMVICVKISMNVIPYLVMTMLHVQIHMVHTSATVYQVLTVMVGLAKTLMNVIQTLVATTVT